MNLRRSVRSLTRDEVRYAAFMTAGLIVFVVVSGAIRSGLSTVQLVALPILTIASVTGFVWVRRRDRDKRDAELAHRSAVWREPH